MDFREVVARRGPWAGFSQGTDFVGLDTSASVASYWALTEDPRFPHDPADLAIGPPVLAAVDVIHRDGW